MKYVAVNETTMEYYSCNNLRILWRVIVRNRKEAREFKRRADSWRLELADSNGDLHGKPFAEIAGGYSNNIRIIRPNGKDRFFVL